LFLCLIPSRLRLLRKLFLFSLDSLLAFLPDPPSFFDGRRRFCRVEFSAGPGAFPSPKDFFVTPASHIPPPPKAGQLNSVLLSLPSLPCATDPSRFFFLQVSCGSRRIHIGLEPQSSVRQNSYFPRLAPRFFFRLSTLKVARCDKKFPATLELLPLPILFSPSCCPSISFFEGSLLCVHLDKNPPQVSSSTSLERFQVITLPPSLFICLVSSTTAHANLEPFSAERSLLAKAVIFEITDFPKGRGGWLTFLELGPFFLSSCRPFL